MGGNANIITATSALGGEGDTDGRDNNWEINTQFENTLLLPQIDY